MGNTGMEWVVGLFVLSQQLVLKILGWRWQVEVDTGGHSKEDIDHDTPAVLGLLMCNSLIIESHYNKKKNDEHVELHNLYDTGWCEAKKN